MNSRSCSSPRIPYSIASLHSRARAYRWSRVVAFGFLLTTAGPTSGQEAVNGVPPDTLEMLGRVTSTLERSSKSYIELRRLFWDPDQDVSVTAIVSPVPGDYPPEMLKGNWARMRDALTKAGYGNDRRYAVRVTVREQGVKTPAWEDRAAIDPEPLVRATRDLVPDKTIRSRLDVDAVLPFRIAAGRLRAGRTYDVMLDFLDPHGQPHPFPSGSIPETGSTFSVRHDPLDLSKILIKGRIIDSTDGLLGRATEIANPGKLRFPKDDADDCQARSVWCLQKYQGRVYVGYGDWAKNRGPIDVWSFAPEANDPSLIARYGRFAFAAGDRPRLLFTREYTIQEHSIERYRVCGDRLLIPGIDGLKEQGPDGIVFGNLYIREKGYWRKISSLPQARHVYDVAEFGGRLFVRADTFTTVVSSDDGGLSWRSLAPGRERPEGDLVPFAGGLLVLGVEGAWHHTGRDSLVRNRVEVTPGVESGQPHRITPFGDGLVYTSWDSWGRSKAKEHPLYFLQDLNKGPLLVDYFRDKNVRDLFEEGGTLYVLTGGGPASGRYTGEIYSTRDLKDWTRVAVFDVPAMPSAFARLENAFYVGLANRGFVSSSGEGQPMTYAHADRAAGSIWLIER